MSAISSAAGETLAVNRWLEKQSPEVRLCAELALKSGPEMLNRREVGSFRLRITRASAEDWSAEVPRLPLAHAVALLRRPLRLMRLWVLFDSDAKQSPARDMTAILVDLKVVDRRDFIFRIFPGLLRQEQTMSQVEGERGQTLQLVAGDFFLPTDLTNFLGIGAALAEDSDLLNNAGRKLRKAAAFLGEYCGIWSPATLPYKYQAIFLADALSRVPGEPGTELSDSLVDALKQWFWLTTYGEYFAATNYSRLRKAVTHVRSVVDQGADPKPDDLVPTVRPWPRFSLVNARSRAILLRLAKLNPLNSEGESQDSEHLLAENGATAAPKLLLANEAGDHEGFNGVENRVIVHPKQQTSLRRALLSPDCNVKILRSHGIEEDASRALPTGKFRDFLTLRREHLIEIERQFVKNLGLEYAEKAS